MQSSSGGTSLDNSALVHKITPITGGTTYSNTKATSSINSSHVTKREASTVKNATFCVQNIRESLRQQNISEDIADILLSSWRQSTQQQYWTYFHKWMLFCERKSINTFQASVNNVLEFLLQLYNSGLGYSAVNTAKSCISSVFEIINPETSLGSNSLIKKFMRGIFNKRPSLPRYACTWDVSLVLEYLKTLIPVNTISLRLLSWKLAMLIALLTGQRCQSLHLIDIRNIFIYNVFVKIHFGDLLKQSKPGSHLQPIELVRYKQDERLCVVKTLQEYLGRTKSLRGEEIQLFVSTMTPHQKISKQTISNWIRTVLENSGIDVKMFKAHSTRTASMSAAKSANVPITTILNVAGWKSDCTFRKFYNKPCSEEKVNVGNIILENYSKS
ncbi:uncharacterized protein LOC134241105 [Saccostrea cucullata]|uniref:uncharacterized protein LOC134241105 n=1 Tax=Saccostrea cuccullata TaxID=36930 RepID=UPI002ED07106